MGKLLEMCLAFRTEKTSVVAGYRGFSFRYSYLKGMRVKCGTAKVLFTVRQLNEGDSCLSFNYLTLIIMDKYDRIMFFL